MNLTDWFTDDQPARIGVYQRDHAGTIEYSYWSGSQWNFGRKTAQEAALQATASRFQNLPWRGLAEPSQAGD